MSHSAAPDFASPQSAGEAPRGAREFSRTGSRTHGHTAVELQRANAALYLLLPNPGHKGLPHQLISDDPDEIGAWAQREDVPGRSVYYCVNPLITGATKRRIETIGEIRCLHVDIDFKDVEEDPDTIDQRLRQLPLPPTEIRNSGGGRHVIWHLREPITRDDPEFELIPALLKRLTHCLCGDPAPAHIAALLRQPGTHNTKHGEPVLCQTLWNGGGGGGGVDPADVEAMLELLQDTPVFTRKDKGTSSGNGQHSTWKAPVDVDARLARMTWHGGGDTAINITQRDVAASMLRNGCSVDVTVDYILGATEQAVAGEPAASDWDWSKEKIQIEGMCFRLINKNPELSHLLPDDLRVKFEALVREGKNPCVHRPFNAAWGVRSSRGGGIPYSRSPRGNGASRVTKGDNALGDVTLCHPPGGSKPPTRPRYRLYRFKDLRPGMGEQNWLVEELIPKEGLVVLWGKYKSLKSFLMLNIFFHVSTGREFRDRRVAQGLVIYCAFEGAHGYAKRAEALRRHYGLGDDDDPPLRLMSAHVDLIKDHTLFIADIRSQLADGEQPVAIVLDTLNRSLRGSESKDADMAAYIEAATAIKDAFKCAVVIVHHCGWDETRMRGHSSLPGAIDTELSARRDGDIVTLKVECMRDGPEDVEVVSTFKKIVVCQDACGKDIDSLVIVPFEGQQPIGQRKHWPPALAKFRTALVEALKQHGETYFPPNQPKSTIRAVDLDDVRERFYQKYIVDGETEKQKRDARKQAFHRMVERAQREKLIEVLVDEKACTTKIWFAQDASSEGEG